MIEYKRLRIKEPYWGAGSPKKYDWVKDSSTLDRFTFFLFGMAMGGFIAHMTWTVVFLMFISELIK